MDKNKQNLEDLQLQEVIIPKQDAVFWMDSQGRWCNRHGRFEHKRIIDHFNRSIRRDEDGYFVTQVRGDVREKVYFPYNVTPLFVLRILKKDPIELVLNTGTIITLAPSELYVQSDELYQRKENGCVKFTDRALIALAPYLEEEKAGGLRIRIGKDCWEIPDRSQMK